MEHLTAEMNTLFDGFNFEPESCFPVIQAESHLGFNIDPVAGCIALDSSKKCKDYPFEMGRIIIFPGLFLFDKALIRHSFRPQVLNHKMI